MNCFPQDPSCFESSVECGCPALCPGPGRARRTIKHTCPLPGPAPPAAAPGGTQERRELQRGLPFPEEPGPRGHQPATQAPPWSFKTFPPCSFPRRHAVPKPLLLQRKRNKREQNGYSSPLPPPCPPVHCPRSALGEGTAGHCPPSDQRQGPNDAGKEDVCLLGGLG